MKVAIFGSYNGTSVGDTAILLGLLRGLYKAAPEAEVTVLSTGPLELSQDLGLIDSQRSPRVLRVNVRSAAEWPLVRSLWWRLQKIGFPISGSINISRCKRVLMEQDVLIVGGGNLVMDLFAGGVDVMASVVNAARSVGTPYVIAGVGAGPVGLESSRSTLASLLACAERVVVRDNESLNICTGILGRGGVEVAADFAFSLEPGNFANERRTLAVNVAGIGSAAWPYRDPLLYRRYLDGIIKLVRAGVDSVSPDYVDLVVTNPAVDLGAAQDLASLMEGGDAADSNPKSRFCLRYSRGVFGC